ncbi:MAG: 23S rRNA (uracil(1939)-C(5))-methyltransferase RlmD [Lachnospiraceae bacterium]|nr:23S rRNA (uracil(1939)-C(5))-methyltransferase RlmD [Lachnospiraceae bacterium]
MNIQKNQIFTVKITDMGADGEGIGHLEEQPGSETAGYTLFVKDALIGDLVRAKIVKVKKGYAFARLEEIIEPSPDRIKPPCAHHRQCGGCQIQALSYEKQLEFKNRKVKNNLIRIGGFDAEFVDELMEAPIGMEYPFRYRNKAQFPVGTDKNGRLITGFYAGRTHTIIEEEDCLLGVEENKQILRIILDFCRERQIPAYDEETGKGLLRHILIRKGFSTGQIMVCLILNGANLPGEKQLADRLFTQVKGMTSFSVNSNTEQTNVIMGKKTRTVQGSDTIEDTIGGLRFKISPQSFYQVNPVQTERIYGKALEYAQLDGKETVWDLYCGIGTISLFLAQKAKEVYGVEIVPQAIQDAKLNAERNGLTNTHFYVGKAEEVLPEKYEKEGIFADVIVVDPPRKGCDEACLSTMVRMRPERIVYVSCDSATLARDLKYLTENGYELKRGVVVDNFSHSTHTETVVLLSRKTPDDTIGVDLDLDELDITSAESKATYQEIKDYVLKEFGLKVSTIYISQIKRKCGIDVGEHYNISQKENQKVPQCPKEKEDAIRAALEHFSMI